MTRLGRYERDFLVRLRDGVRLRLADREEDRLRQKMRKAGYAEVVMQPRRWQLTAAGRAALSQSPDNGEPRHE